MEWLKDKKNLPIVAGLAAFVILIAGGLVAYTLGAFNGSSAAPPAVVAAAPVSGYPGGAPGGYPGGGFGGGGGYPGTLSAGVPRPAVASASANPTKVPTINPMVGADPFALAGAAKPLSPAAALKIANAMRPPLRDSLPPMDLFTIHPPRPEVSPSLTLPAGAEQLLASTRVSGIVNAADGIFAVVEINGTSQTVKPGDDLPDGSKVASIQSTGVTLHTPGGGAVTVPLSNGAPEQNQPNPYGGGGYPGGFPGGYPGGYPGGGFGGGYPGGYPGGGFGGGGYPGGGFGGGGYPGGGFPGGGGGGYPGGGFGGGGGYPGGPPDGRDGG